MLEFKRIVLDIADISLKGLAEVLLIVEGDSDFV